MRSLSENAELSVQLRSVDISPNGPELEFETVAAIRLHQIGLGL